MLKKIYIILIILLLILLPIINSSIFELFGLKLGLTVNGNYEFTKVIFFNIYSSIILLLYIIDIYLNKKTIYIPGLVYFLIFILTISTYFSLSPYISFFGNSSKAHSLIMFLNLIGLYIIFININKKNKKNILNYSIIGLVLTSIIAIWQLYFPTFNYGNLSNRALGTFGHPNYLALYILLYIPLLYGKKIKKFEIKSLKNKLQYYSIFNILTKFKFNFIIKIIYIIINSIKLFLLNPFLILALIIICLFLTKSLIAIIIAFIYTVYFLFKKLNKKNKKYYLFLIVLTFLSALFLIIYNFGFTKLHSFFSRYFIWKSVIGLNLESLKIFLFGHGFETLNLVFDKNKSPFLYIFENIGFSADRPHNIFLQFFYNLGIGGLIIIVYILIYIIKSKSSAYKHSLMLAFIFLFFNFASIASYVLLILLLAIMYKKNINNNFNQINKLTLIILMLISIYGGYNSYNFYKAENSIKKGQYKNIIQIYKYNPNYYIKNGDFKNGLKYNKIKTELYYKSKIYFQKDINNGCIELTNSYPSVENHFFCGNLYWKFGQRDIAKTYYNIGLNKLPDLWNKNSKYYNYKLIKNTINGNRFFSPKYSNLLEILKRVGIKK